MGVMKKLKNHVGSDSVVARISQVSLNLSLCYDFCVKFDKL